MDVEKIIESKNELDYQLSKLVTTFENETGMEISSVVIKREVLNDEQTIGVRTFVVIA